MVDETLKILRGEECAELVRTLVFKGSPVDLADGFVHLSTWEQAPETAAKHFAGEAGLWLLCIEPSAMGAALRWEPSRGGALFPHLYGHIEAAMARWIKPLPLGPDGRHVFPERS